MKTGERHKKQKREPKYLLSQEVFNYMVTGFVETIPANFVFLVVLYFLGGNYPPMLANFDIAIFLSGMAFLLFLKPAMLRGTVPAYYRRSYGDIGWYLWVSKYVIHGAFVRVPVFVGLNLLNLALSDTPYYVSRYQNALRSFVSMPKIGIMGALVVALTIYLLFYHDRFVSVKEYSNGVIGIMKERKIAEVWAARAFIDQRERGYEAQKTEAVRYDEPSCVSQEAPVWEAIDSEEKKVDTTVPENEMPNLKVDVVRRKARVQ